MNRGKQHDELTPGESLSDPSETVSDCAVGTQMKSAETNENGHIKPSLTYIAMIAKAILSSPSQKLNLSSIYKDIEDHFPYYRFQGQGWRNSVRHNLSLNDCFIKVGRCEDGKGNYWGIHPAHRNDFLRGDFRQHRKAKKKRLQKELQRPYEMSCFTGSGICPQCYLQQAFLSRTYSSFPLPVWEQNCSNAAHRNCWEYLLWRTHTWELKKAERRHTAPFISDKPRCSFLECYQNPYHLSAPFQTMAYSQGIPELIPDGLYSLM